MHRAGAGEAAGLRTGREQQSVVGMVFAAGRVHALPRWVELGHFAAEPQPDPVLVVPILSAQRQPFGRRGRGARENAGEFAAHIRALGLDTWLGATPQRLTREKEQWRLDLSGDPRSLSGAAVVIATGTWLGVVMQGNKVTGVFDNSPAHVAGISPGSSSTSASGSR